MDVSQHIHVFRHRPITLKKGPPRHTGTFSGWGIAKGEKMPAGLIDATLPASSFVPSEDRWRNIQMHAFGTEYEHEIPEWMLEIASEEPSDSPAVQHQLDEDEQRATAQAPDVEILWSQPKSPKKWGIVFGMSPKTMVRWFKAQKIRNKEVTDRNYRIAIDDLPPGERAKYPPSN